MDRPRDFDPERSAGELAAWIRARVEALGRRGVVLGLSGGVDSSVCAALAARALGPARVLALLLPERECPPEVTELGRRVARRLGIETLLEDLTPMLEAAGCYHRRDAAAARAIPGFGRDWRLKLVRVGGLRETGPFESYKLVAVDPAGRRHEARPQPADLLELVAATNLKQRCRKTIEYTHADRLRYAVLGTPNRLEYALGFFVKQGDGAADLKPIAHLYKHEVRALAAHLDLPAEVLGRGATTDTYSLPQSQEEFFFGLPLAELDAALALFERGLDVPRAAAALGWSESETRKVFGALEAKRRRAAYLHAPPLVPPGAPSPHSPES